jgi:cation diffusion facilitator family transporter
VLRRAASVAVSGDRAHYASDLASNLAALVGIAGVSLVGWTWLDPAAGLVVAAILVWSAVGVFREASNQLMDHELPEEDRARIVALVEEDPRVIQAHHLRTRASGPYMHIQLHLDLDPSLTLEAAHSVLIAAERRVLAAFPAADMIIHLNPHGADAPHGGPFSEAHAVGEIAS